MCIRDRFPTEIRGTAIGLAFALVNVFLTVSTFLVPIVQTEYGMGGTMLILLAGLQATFTRLETLRIPVIVAIQGGCVGGAVDLVTAACIRYATQDAFFCIQEINIGMVADVGTLQRLPKLMPLAVVKELAYTGRRLPAARAREYGLVNEVFDTPEACLAAAMQCAQEIAAKPPVAIWGSKQVIHYARDHSVDDSLRQMGWVQGAIWSNAHVREAVAAMQAKRAGQFPPLAELSEFGD